MSLVCGTDIIEIKRIQKAIEASGNHFLERVFTPTEIIYCESKQVSKMKSYAARFAAKEAVAKALGTGIAQGINFIDIEITNVSGGKPTVNLSNHARRIADESGIQEIAISMSHCHEFAIAYAVAEKIMPHISNIHSNERAG